MSAHLLGWESLTRRGARYIFLAGLLSEINVSEGPVSCYSFVSCVTNQLDDRHLQLSYLPFQLISIGTQLEVNIFDKTGNDSVNAIFEHSLSDWDNEKEIITFDKQEETEARLKFCKNKWHERKYFCKRTYLKKMHEIDHEEEESESESESDSSSGSDDDDDDDESDDEEKEMAARRAKMLGGNGGAHNNNNAVISNNNRRSFLGRSSSTRSVSHSQKDNDLSQSSTHSTRSAAMLQRSRDTLQKRSMSARDLLGRLNDVSMGPSGEKKGSLLETKSKDKKHSNADEERMFSSETTETEPNSDAEDCDLAQSSSSRPGPPRKTASVEEMANSNIKSLQRGGLAKSNSMRGLMGALGETSGNARPRLTKALSHRPSGGVNGIPWNNASSMGMKIDVKKSSLSSDTKDIRLTSRLGKNLQRRDDKLDASSAHSSQSSRTGLQRLKKSLSGPNLMARMEDDSLLDDSSRNAMLLPAGLRVQGHPPAPPDKALQKSFSFSNGSKDAKRPTLVRKISQRSLRNLNNKTDPPVSILTQRMSQRNQRTSGGTPSILSQRMSQRNQRITSNDDGASNHSKRPALTQRLSQRKLKDTDKDTSSHSKRPGLTRRSSGRSLRNVGNNCASSSPPRTKRSSSSRNLLGALKDSASPEGPLASPRTKRSSSSRNLLGALKDSASSDGPSPSPRTKRSLSSRNLLGSLKDSPSPERPTLLRKSFSGRDLAAHPGKDSRSKSPQMQRSRSNRALSPSGQGGVIPTERQVKRNSSFRNISDNTGGGDSRKLERQQSITVETAVCQSRTSRLFDPGQKALALLMQDSIVGAFEASAANLAFTNKGCEDADGRLSPTETRLGLTRRLSGRRSPAVQKMLPTVEDDEGKEEKEEEVKPEYDSRKTELERTASQKRLDHSPRHNAVASGKEFSPRRSSDFSRAANDKLTGSRSTSPPRRSSFSPIDSDEEKRPFKSIQSDGQGTRESSTSRSRSEKGKKDRHHSHSSRGSHHSRHSSRHSSSASNDLQHIINKVGLDLESGNHYWIKMIDQWVEQG